MDFDLIGTFFVLVGLELVLGIDNILLIAIVTERLPKHQQAFARRLGLVLAAGIRVLLLLGATWLTQLTTPVVTIAGFGLSWRDIILLGGGLILLWKSVKEIHHMVGGEAGEEDAPVHGTITMPWAIGQILVLDVVFSIDSIITAVGLTNHVGVMIAAVLVTIGAMLFFAGPVASFIQSNPALKILALSFLVCIGATLFMEGMHKEVPKAYLYLPMGFALVVELVQMRYAARKKAKKAKTKGA
jgi:predicted tellurium resistance membrane protein TerC